MIWTLVGLVLLLWLLGLLGGFAFGGLIHLLLVLALVIVLVQLLTGRTPPA